MKSSFSWRGLRLRVPAGRKAQRLSFPVAGPVRIALIEQGFSAERNVREFDPEDLADLHSYAPEALVAPLDLALSLSDQKSRGLIDLHSLNVAIVVLTSLDDSPLTDDHRDLLWRAFGVPIFEQLRGRDGAVIARECEVHDGLHLDGSIAVPDLPGQIVSERCECGLETPRLKTLAPAYSPILGTPESPGVAHHIAPVQILGSINRPSSQHRGKAVTRSAAASACRILWSRPRCSRRGGRAPSRPSRRHPAEARERTEA